MSRSFIHLRRALFGGSCAIVFGFGATHAFAAPRETRVDGACVRVQGGSPYCRSWCQGQGYRDGTCTRLGFCACL